jgi:hypothetical protein
MRYRTVLDGVWTGPFAPTTRRVYLRCCDCGLVHRVDLKVAARQVYLRTTRLRRKRS